ncbi:MAG: sigma-70 family RNA polymerase sigma factor [Planctomycetota bacterium]
MSREEDYDLVRQLVTRDPRAREAAFDALFTKFQNRVFNTACRVLGDRDLAADVTQETFITIMKKAGRFDFRAAFSSWVYRITVNLCIDVRRKRSRQRALSLGDPEVTGWAEGSVRGSQSGSEEGPEAAARKKELQAAVGKAVAALNPRLSSVVVLRYTEGLGYEEIAEVLRVPLGTVKSRLNRAHAALEVELGPRLVDYA